MTASSYIYLIRNDVIHHKFNNDGQGWPSAAIQRAQAMQDALRLPAWLKSGPYPRVDGYAQPIINELRASCATLSLDFWDLAENATDEDQSGRRFRAGLGITLSDCASIRNVVQVEKLDDVPIPKESFLVVLVRNVFTTLVPQVLSLEEVPVSLPRHFSGEPNPLLKFMSKSVIAPLVVTVCEKIRIEDTDDGESESHREDVNSSNTNSSELPCFATEHSLSEFLRRCERPLTADGAEEEEDDVDKPLPGDFDAHFLSYPSSMKTSPSTCCIPVLCMADDKQLPELMSSLLYQRRVWHIDEPLIGIGFSKYDTTIRLYLGWLVEDMGSERVLPYVHLGQVETSVILDLSTPLIALAISNLIIRLGSHISDIDAIVHHIAPAVIAEIQSQSSFAWRIDTRVRESNPISNVQRFREQIMRWAENQNYTPYEENTTKSMPSTSESDASSTPPKLIIPSSTPTPEISDGGGNQADSNVLALPSFKEQMSCSAFAGMGAIDDYEICSWLFDRKTVPQALAPDNDDPYFKKYTEMTDFIWPTTWDIRENLPQVDAGLETCVEQLLKIVNEFKLQPNTVRLIEPDEFPADFKLLSSNFSAIFNSSCSARGRADREENVCDASWRHDHDRFLLDFFKLQVPNSEDMAADPSVRPIMGCTLRFPKSDRMENTLSKEAGAQIRQLVYKPMTLVHEEWILRRGGEASGVVAAETNNQIHIIQQHGRWSNDVNEFQRLINLGGDPASGKCDALGRVQVELPYVVPKDFALTRAAVEINSNAETRKAEKAYQPDKMSETSRSSQVPDNAEPTIKTYSILSASVSSTIQESPVISDFDNLQIGDDKGTKEMKGYLDLPIIAIEYTKQLADAKKGTNQLRMHLTACVKFLHVLGITEFMVFGIQTDGTHTAFPAAVMTDDGIIHLYERLVDSLDISNPLGAWHFVTILNRLATQHAECLREKFNEKKERLVTLLGKKDLEPELRWTIEHQRTKLVETGQVKPREEKTSKKASSKGGAPAYWPHPKLAVVKRPSSFGPL
ncbi:hypothetical protein APHAL10511_003803 [Amanita phalloides]|nr:hypothetical protein APHAL10511_003803 [Amanita phalloides]